MVTRGGISSKAKTDSLHGGYQIRGGKPSCRIRFTRTTRRSHGPTTAPSTEHRFWLAFGNPTLLRALLLLLEDHGDHGHQLAGSCKTTMHAVDDRDKVFRTAEDAASMSDASIAAGAAATKATPDPPSSTAWLWLVIACMLVPTLLLVLSTLPLWSCTDHPVRAVLCVCALICPYLSGWTIALSTTMAGYAVMRVLLFPMIGCAIAGTGLPMAGTMVMYLGTICNAGSCGYALAERRQLLGAETSAETAARDPEFAGMELYLEVPLFLVRLFTGVCGVMAVAYCCAGHDAPVAAVELPGALLITCLFFWWCYLNVCLRFALFSAGTLCCSLFCGVKGFYLLLVPFTIFFGDPGAAVLCWSTAIAVAALLGYTMAVYNRYMAILAQDSMEMEYEGAKETLDCRREMEETRDTEEDGLWLIQMEKAA
ncbi:hypothetical protein ACP70R_001077 [Stipagrostis hirtigluma subsp. patula]